MTVKRAKADSFRRNQAGGRGRIHSDRASRGCGGEVGAAIPRYDEYVYCSGPLFCPEEIAGMAAIAAILEDAGFGTFLPQRDGIERLVMGFANSSLNVNIFGTREKIDRAIFALDVFQIVKRCNHFVFNMNGRVPDEGAVAEAGIAFSSGKKVILYKNDCRSAFKGRDNSMLLALSPISPVKDIRKLPEAIRYEAQKKESCEKKTGFTLSENLLRTVNYGERLWTMLESLPKKHTRTKDRDNLVKGILKLSEEQ